MPPPCTPDGRGSRAEMHAYDASAAAPPDGGRHLRPKRLLLRHRAWHVASTAHH
jgi:hypothetical protein